MATIYFKILKFALLFPKNQIKTLIAFQLQIDNQTTQKIVL